MTNLTSVSSSSATALLVRKTFASRAEYAIFAQSPEAPRYSVTLSGGTGSEDERWLGVANHEALFSNDLPALSRASIAWDTNGFEVFIDKASNYPDIDCEDSWHIRANANVPAWFLEDVLVYLHLTLDSPIGEVEASVVQALCESNGSGHPLFFIDKMADSEYLTEVIEDAEEHKGWGCCL